MHAQSLLKQGVKLKGMISLEMIGYFSDEPGSQGFPLEALRLLYPSQGNFIVVAGTLKNRKLIKKIKTLMQSARTIPTYSLCGPADFGSGLSDNWSYWQAGYDAVMLTDSAFYRNRNYHTEQDTPDRLDYKRMAQVVEALVPVVMGL